MLQKAGAGSSCGIPCECQTASGGDKTQVQRIMRSCQDLHTLGPCSQLWRKPRLEELQPNKKSQGGMVPRVGQTVEPDVFETAGRNRRGQRVFGIAGWTLQADPQAGNTSRLSPDKGVHSSGGRKEHTNRPETEALSKWRCAHPATPGSCCIHRPQRLFVPNRPLSRAEPPPKGKDRAAVLQNWPCRPQSWANAA